MSAALLLSTGTQQSLRFLDAPAPWVVALIVVPGCALLAWISYAREPLPAGARVLLAGLRALALLALCALLARPVREIERIEVHPAEAVVALDDSASMLRKDSYAGDAAARARLAELSGRQVESSTRLELARDTLARRLLPVLEQRGYAVELAAFAGSSRQVATLAELNGSGAATHIGSSALELVNKARGRHLTDIVIVSDGRNTGGSALAEAARAIAPSGISVHTVVVGDASPEADLSIELVEAPTTALTGDELSIVVRVVGRGLRPGQLATVTLEELEPDGRSTRTLDTHEAALREDGERVLLLARSEGESGQRNERRLRARVQPLPGEPRVDDNQVDFAVRLSDQKVRVLYIEGYPRWEYRLLVIDLLKRSDARIQFQSWLLSSDSDARQECSKDLEPLTRLPGTREELLRDYDVVLLGDVGPYDLYPNESERCLAFWRALVEFARAGGGVLFQAGEAANPRAYLGTPLEELLPVLVDPAEADLSQDREHEFRVRLEDARAPHEIVRLLPEPEANRALWEDAGGLHGFFWFFPVKDAKPLAQVLARHPSQGNQRGAYPLIVTGYYPSGRTLFLGFDSTWLWRYRFSLTYIERFWRNALRWLSLGRLKGGDRRYRLESTRSSYDLSERAELEARVLDQDFRESTAPTQPVRWSGPDGREHDLELAAVAGAPGIYRGSIPLDQAGAFRAWIESEGARVVPIELLVTLPSAENADPSPDPEALRQLAAGARGRAVDLAHIDELLDQFPGNEEWREPLSAELADLWDGWWSLAAVLALLAVEWVLRKRWELV